MKKLMEDGTNFTEGRTGFLSKLHSSKRTKTKEWALRIEPRLRINGMVSYTERKAWK